MPAGQIGKQLGLPSATLSFHLKSTEAVELVTVRREGRSLIYTAEYHDHEDLAGYLTENCCQGDPAACGIACLCIRYTQQGGTP